jgi:hypothetical protein
MQDAAVGATPEGQFQVLDAGLGGGEVALVGHRLHVDDDGPELGEVHDTERTTMRNILLAAIAATVIGATAAPLGLLAMQDPAAVRPARQGGRRQGSGTSPGRR